MGGPLLRRPDRCLALGLRILEPRALSQDRLSVMEMLRKAGASLPGDTWGSCAHVDPRLGLPHLLPTHLLCQAVGRVLCAFLGERCWRPVAEACGFT